MVVGPATLLLAAALATKQLDNRAFFDDEPDSLYTAGINNAGPRNLAEVWEFVVDTHPTQTQGWSKLLFIWGRIAGWSEPAIRALSLFAGMLALAWVYRAGRDFFSPQTGLVAALMLGTSAVFLAYMEFARAFTMVALFTALILWSYWRVALHPRSPGPGAQAGLLLGSIGLLYSHYFGSLFLPALGLFHLLFVPKKGRWWRTVLLVGLAAMVAALQLPGFLNGLTKSAADEKLHNVAMTAAEIAGRFLHFLSNYLISLPLSVSAALPVLLLLALAVATILHLRSDRRADAGWLIAFVAATSLLLMIAANELVSCDEGKPDPLPDAAVAAGRPVRQQVQTRAGRPIDDLAHSRSGSRPHLSRIFQNSQNLVLPLRPPGPAQARYRGRPCPHGPVAKGEGNSLSVASIHRAAESAL